MKDFDYSVSLRVRHPSIDPQELTAHLGFAPEHFWRAGDRKRDAAGAPAEGTYRETYWLGRMPATPYESVPDQQLEGAIMFALLHIQRADAFWSRLTESGGTARIIVEIVGGADMTLDLSPTTLAMLARFGVAISFDVHADAQAAA